MEIHYHHVHHFDSLKKIKRWRINRKARSFAIITRMISKTFEIDNSLLENIYKWLIVEVSTRTAFDIGCLLVATKLAGVAPKTKNPRAAPATTANPNQTLKVMKTSMSRYDMVTWRQNSAVWTRWRLESSFDLYERELNWFIFWGSISLVINFLVL